VAGSDAKQKRLLRAPKQHPVTKFSTGIAADLSMLPAKLFTKTQFLLLNLFMRGENGRKFKDKTPGKITESDRPARIPIRRSVGDDPFGAAKSFSGC
jgi:hypothetical protein